MRRLRDLLAFVLLGLGAAWVLQVDAASLPHSTAYRLVAFLLLAIGLYGATYGIDLHQATTDKKIIISAVTVGVVVKALIIGGTLALAWHDPIFLILGVAVAQIDPLSVASLMGDGRMSPRARTVLAAWSSFDDPVTVILTVYATAIAASAFGLGAAAAGDTANPLLGYAVDLGGNVVLTLIAWVVWRLVGRIVWLQYAALACFVLVAMATGWMLAIALIGLFFRPAALDALIPKITNWAMYAAATALGVLLIGGVSPVEGLTLGLAAFAAQAIVAWPLTRGMPRADRLHLAAAQQHGITAIILALTLEMRFEGVVAVIAPTIVTVNLVHLVVNRLLDRRLHAPGASPPEARDLAMPQPRGGADPDTLTQSQPSAEDTSGETAADAQP